MVIFNTWVCGLFLLVVFCVYWLSPWRWRRHLSKGATWVWVKVALCLLVLDLLLFRAGLLWQVTPNFGADFFSAGNWYLLYVAAHEFETQRTAVGKTALVGSSVMIFGADGDRIEAQLRPAGVPQLLYLTTHGSDATDSALLVWNSLPTHPWLVVYGAAFRDFPKAVPAETGVTRIFYDSSVDLPALPRTGAEVTLDAWVKRYWKLYRYRFFARSAFETAVGDLPLRFHLPPMTWATDLPSPPELPAEVREFFPPGLVPPESVAVWSTWRRTRQFADYSEWMRLAGSLALEAYKAETLATYGPDGNPQVESFRWMLSTLREHHIPCIIVSFPENPVFHDPAAQAYFDPQLSQAYADLFQREAAVHGARFVDLRDFVEAEGFYDMIHLNLMGQRKLSDRLATIILEEWSLRNRAGHLDSPQGRPR